LGEEQSCVSVEDSGAFIRRDYPFGYAIASEIANSWVEIIFGKN
jgi:hypothetical protein